MAKPGHGGQRHRSEAAEFERKYCFSGRRGGKAVERQQIEQTRTELMEQAPQNGCGAVQHGTHY